MPRPPSDNPAVKKTISLTPDQLRRALVNAKVRGFGASFSAYIAWLIGRDASGSVEREEIPRRAR